MVVCVLVQRPIPKRAADSGVWEYVLVAQAWCAVLSNVLLFGFASDQLAVLVPEWFEVVGTHSRRGVSSHVYAWRAGEGRDVVAAMWVLEHAVLLAALALWLALPAVAPSVSTRIARSRYLEAQAARGVDLRPRVHLARGGPPSVPACLPARGPPVPGPSRIDDQWLRRRQVRSRKSTGCPPWTS